MKTIDDITIGRASKGNEKAFRKIYDHYAPFVWKVIYRTARGNEESAREIIQNTFIRVYKSLKNFNHNSELSTWIYRIAYNCAITYLTGQNRNNTINVQYDDELHSSDNRSRYEVKDEVQKILNTLDPDERFLITSREINGYSFEELEHMTGKSSGALRTSLSRIKEKIRKEFNSGNE